MYAHCASCTCEKDSRHYHKDRANATQHKQTLRQLDFFELHSDEYFLPLMKITEVIETFSILMTIIPWLRIMSKAPRWVYLALTKIPNRISCEIYRKWYFKKAFNIQRSKGVVPPPYRKKKLLLVHTRFEKPKSAPSGLSTHSFGYWQYTPSGHCITNTYFTEESDIMVNSNLVWRRRPG